MKLIILAGDGADEHHAVFDIGPDSMVVPEVGDKIYWKECDLGNLPDGQKSKRWSGKVGERMFNFIETPMVVTLVIKNFHQF
jgi:hypothetical protein